MIKGFNDWSLKTKAGVGTAIIALLFILVVGSGALIIDKAVRGFTVLVHMSQLQEDLTQMRADERNFAFTGKDTARESFEQHYAAFTDEAAITRSFFHEEVSFQFFQQITDNAADYATTFRAYAERAEKDPAALTAGREEMNKKGVAVVLRSNELLNERVLLGQASLAKARNIMIICSLIVVLLCAGTIAALVMRLISYVTRCVRFAQDIAGNDLSNELDLHLGDEVGQLADALNAMQKDLGDIVGQVRVNAEQMSTDSAQVSATSENVSQGATEQAASVEEIAATIEEMSSSIKANADNAVSGRELARSAVQAVEVNNRLSNEVTRSMAEISESSGRIGNIIATVNEVAFQTNLLALNAAVEAARAGEHGKGFAVVADEVRALAQRSADAARQIKGLIEDTVTKIEAGGGIVKESAEALERIHEHTENLSQSMEEIAAASAEQASGIDELNRAIAQVDAATQTSAAMVEELAGTANQMKVGSASMEQLVQSFKLKDIS